MIGYAFAPSTWPYDPAAEPGFAPAIVDPYLPIGKGIFVWNYPRIGTPTEVRDGCVELGLRHVIIKIADGKFDYPDGVNIKYDLAELVRLLKEAGIQVWGYHYPYLGDMREQAKKAIERILEFDLFGLVINAESSFRPNQADAAADYMDAIGENIFLYSPERYIPLCLSSNRYPLTSWTDFPWSAFRMHVDFDMPQVYWLRAHNPAWQLRESYRQFKAMTDLPFIPTGSTWKEDEWECTVADVTAFMDTARELDCQAFNFWEYSRLLQLPDLWEAIANYDFGGAPIPPEPTPEPIPGDTEMTKDEILVKLNDIAWSTEENLRELRKAISALMYLDTGGTPPPTPPPPAPVTATYLVTADKSLANWAKDYNKADPPRPIMYIYETPRYRYNEGNRVPVWPGKVRADGGSDWYEIYGTVGAKGEKLYLDCDKGKLV